MIYGIVLGIHVLVCLALVLVVLLQSSKGGGLAGAFGGGAENTVFGGRGAATVLSKATTIFGAGFMITSLTLTLMSAGGSRTVRSVVAEEAAQSPLGAPATGTALPGGPGQGALPGGADPTQGGTVPGGPAGDGGLAPPPIETLPNPAEGATVPPPTTQSTSDATTTPPGDGGAGDQ